MGLKFFEFRVTNKKTGESTGFLGQGETMQEAWSDGTSNVTAIFRPKQDGKARRTHGLAVTTSAGSVVIKTLQEFEGDTNAGA